MRHSRKGVATNAVRSSSVRHKGFHTPLAVGTANVVHGDRAAARAQVGAGRWNLCDEVRYLHFRLAPLPIRTPGRQADRYVTAPGHDDATASAARGKPALGHFDDFRALVVRPTRWRVPVLIG